METMTKNSIAYRAALIARDLQRENSRLQRIVNNLDDRRRGIHNELTALHEGLYRVLDELDLDEDACDSYGAGPDFTTGVDHAICTIRKELGIMATSPKSYRYKPVEVEATQWNGTTESAIAIIRWVRAHGGAATYQRNDQKELAATEEPYSIMIGTIEGDMRALPGDYIIRGVAKEFYPCKPDTFNQTYDEIPMAEQTDRAERLIEELRYLIDNPTGRNRPPAENNPPDDTNK